MNIACTTLESSVPRVSESPAPTRRTMFDVGRLAAAYAIIWLHAMQSPAMEDSTALGRFAVPYFVLLTIVLVFEGVARRPQRDAWDYTCSRTARLYLPFIGWSGIYLAFKVLKGWLLPGEPNDYPGIEILWFGSCYHLWFLPFILMISLLAFAVAKMLAFHPDRAPTAFAVALAAGVVIAVVPIYFTRPDTYVELVVNALPATGCGIALAIACQLLGTRILERPSATLTGVLVAVICTAWVWQFGRDRLVETLAGLGVFVAAFAPVTGRLPSLVTVHGDCPDFRGNDAKMGLSPSACERLLSLLGKLGTLALGIYLSHLLWIKIVQAVTLKAGFQVTWQRDVAVFLISALLSTLVAWGLTRSRWTAWLAA